MKKPQKMERLAYRKIGDETIILDTKINKEIHQLNEVASFVWELCDGKHDVQSIIQKVCEEFDVAESVAVEDINAIIAELDAKSLLTDNSL
ncbi:MAG: PqqD family protein [Bacteriovorax sp.]|jgi:hypothetical protein